MKYHIMKKNNQKQVYSTPEIVCIVIDAEISIQLESSPPEGPSEFTHSTQLNMNNPFKDSKNLV
jgi:hypothetical protein